MNKLIKLVVVGVLIFFFSIFFGRYSAYFENKTVLTDQAIERFEKDLKEGREIVASNYIEDEKNYDNKASEIGIKASKAIENSFNKGMKFLMKYLAKMQ